MAQLDVALASGLRHTFACSSTSNSVQLDRDGGQGLYGIKGPAHSGTNSIATELDTTIPRLCGCVGHRDRKRSHAIDRAKLVSTS